MFSGRKFKQWKKTNQGNLIEIISGTGCGTEVEHELNKETDYKSKKQSREFTKKLIKLGYVDSCKEGYEKEERAKIAAMQGYYSQKMRGIR
jgi:hypothetical protein